MLLKQLNREDQEKVFIPLMNVSGVTVSVGQFVCYDWQNSASLGVVFNKPATSNLGLFAGVVCGKVGEYANIGKNSIGLIQAFGVHDSVAMYVGTASVSCAGAYLLPMNAQWSGIEPVGAVDFSSPFASEVHQIARAVFCMNNDLSGANFNSGFIRAL